MVVRDWGYFEVIESGGGYTIKRLVITPGKAIHLQSHRCRSEQWTVICGSGLLVLGDSIMAVKHGTTVTIPVMMKHKITNISEEPLIIIEVWYGTNLDEKDIIHYD
jgi:mannose-6-phosphate isomerase-like protein (cupin superfamily)